MVTISPTLINASKGESVEFYCSVAGIDTTDLDYQWFLNQLLISDQNTSTLTINEVTYANSGNYTCTVRNPYRRNGHSGVGTLFILGKYVY